MRTASLLKMLIDAIGGDQSGAAFVAVTDDLEQAVGAELVDGQVAQFVDAQHLRLDVMVAGALDANALSGKLLALAGKNFRNCAHDLAAFQFVEL